jgi:hypothetical protein
LAVRALSNAAAQVVDEDQFLPVKLSVRSVIRKQTVTATRGKGRDAPKADFGLAPLNLVAILR